jgi:hypothetical protein
MDKKKMSIAVAAVMNYIYEESLACAVHTMSQPKTAPQPKVAHNTWGTSGRLDAMQLRQLMQLRTFKSKGF